MDFPLYFQNLIWPGGTSFFIKNLFLKKPNTWECSQVLVVTWVKLDCVEALLSPDPIYWSLSCEECRLLGFKQIFARDHFLVIQILKTSCEMECFGWNEYRQFFVLLCVPNSSTLLLFIAIGSITRDIKGSLKSPLLPSYKRAWAELSHRLSCGRLH